jgi:hypothetical protein
MTTRSKAILQELVDLTRRVHELERQIRDLKTLLDMDTATGGAALVALGEERVPRKRRDRLYGVVEVPFSEPGKL